MGGRRVPPQEEAPGRGMGTGESLHSRPRPQSPVARGWAGEGSHRSTHTSLRAALALLLAGEGLEAKKQFHPLPSLSHPSRQRTGRAF